MHRVHVYYDRWPQLADVLREHADPERSTDEYAAITSEQWRALRPNPTPHAKGRAEMRADVCRECDRVKRDEQGAPNIRFTVKGRDVYTVGCHDCGCAGLSLLRGTCPLDKWQEVDRQMEVQRQAFETARQKRAEREARREQKAREQAQRHAKARAKPKGKPADDQLVLRDGWGNPTNMRELYRGASAFLLCGGPSLAEMDLTPLNDPGILTMAVNNAAKVFRPNLWTCVDSADHFLRSVWLDPTITKLVPDKLKGSKVFDSDQWGYIDKKVHQCPNVLYYPRKSRFDHTTYLDEPFVTWGSDKGVKDSTGQAGSRSVMLSALRLLHHLGVRTVYLLGCDFHMTPEQSYGFEERKKEGACRGNNNTYRVLNRRFKALRPLFEQRGFQVFNATPGGTLEAFERIDFQDAVKQARDQWGNIDVKNERTRGLYTLDKQRPPPEKLNHLQAK